MLMGVFRKPRRFWPGEGDFQDGCRGLGWSMLEYRTDDGVAKTVVFEMGRE
jgi:hypothetical protein